MADLSYRIRTSASSNKDVVINIPINGTYDMFEILSLELSQKNMYKLPQSGYGVLIGRVLANGNFGVPNAKISVFIPYDGNGIDDEYNIYPYSRVSDVNYDDVRYNLLSSDTDDSCHQDVGTFPTKRFVLDNGAVIDVFEKYYKYTTSTNKAGDYMIYGVPVGVNELHVDVDLSDIGVLSQTPRDMIYKGYDINQFESPSKFKKSENLNSLPQIYSQNKSVYVYPFWGDTTDTTTDASVTRCDIKIDYKFEPTCVFMGSVVTDSGENGITKRCIPTAKAGKMSELRAGEGVIEMIRKTPTGKVEYFSVQGNKLIDGDGVWCYQIPMNLDYVMTDEFGNIVPTDDPENGIPTRTCVRFRVSLTETGDEGVGFKRARYLIPNNPDIDGSYDDKKIDYEFGSLTKDDSYRDLLWNHVYTVKSYIPRLQKDLAPLTRHFTGIKAVNHAGDNNPMPYNNIQIRLGFVYRILCMIAFVIISIVTMLNMALTGIAKVFWLLSGEAFKPNCKCDTNPVKKAVLNIFAVFMETLFGWWCNPVWHSIGCGIELRGWCEQSTASFFPGCGKAIPAGVYSTSDGNDSMSGFSGDFSEGDADSSDEGGEDCHERKCKMKALSGENKVAVDGTAYARSVEEYLGIDINNNPKSLMECIQSEMAEDNEVVSLNFQNDWINGVLYMPLWGRKIRKRKYSLFGWNIYRNKDIFCNSSADSYVNRKTEGGYRIVNKKYVPKHLRLYHTCSQKRSVQNGRLMPIPEYENPTAAVDLLTSIETNISTSTLIPTRNTCYGFNCDKEFDYTNIDAGVITEKSTILDEQVYYYKPSGTNGFDSVYLFATDIVLLGSLNGCDKNGTPQFFSKLSSTTYRLPSNLVLNDIVSADVVYNAEKNTITTENEKYRAEMTGMDWGMIGGGQRGGGGTWGGFSVESSQDGGLFYGITCNFTSVSPKSCVNLSRICEYGVGLDESKYLFSPNRPDEQIYLAPDGFVSADEIDDIDGRSMFATLNGNGLKTKLNGVTGYPEYDFKYSYQNMFDRSLYDIMKKSQSSLGMNNISYKENYKLEEYGNDYVRFRYGGEPSFYDSSAASSISQDLFGNKIPEYKNSFYFYFGLKEGKTAIDKFRELYYSECDTDITEDNVNIEYKPNSWCSEFEDEGVWKGDGYIALDLENIDTPYSMYIDSRVDNDFDFVITSLSAPRVYIGLVDESEVPAGYQRVEYSYEDENHEVHNEPVPLINGVYNITIVDINNESTSFIIDLMEDVVDFELSASDFSVENSELFNENGDYCICDSNNVPSYKCIAAYQNNNNREIGGVVRISGISTNDSNSYRIEVNAVPGSRFDDFVSYHIAYAGERFDFVGGHIENLENGSYNSVTYGENGDYVIEVGVPKGDVVYSVRVTQICDNGNVSRNTNISSVEVRPYVPPVMFVNGIDSRLLSHFFVKTGWNVTGGLHTEPAPNGVDEAKIWVEGIDNIGGQYVIVLRTDSDDLPSWSELSLTMGSLLTISGDSDCNYRWTQEYCVDLNVLMSYIVVSEFYRLVSIQNQESLFDLTIDSLDSFEWRLLFGTDFDFYNYNWPQYFKVLKEDGVTYSYFRRDVVISQIPDIPSTVSYVRSDNPITLQEFYEENPSNIDGKIALINYINSITEKRISLVQDMKRSFWVSGDSKTLTVTSSSERLPVKTLMFGPRIGNDQDGNQTHTFVIVDPDVEENTTTFNDYQIAYDSNGVLILNKDANNEEIEPFYCATKDDAGLVCPNGFDSSSFDAQNSLVGMAPVLFFKRPMDVKIVSWSYVNYPNHNGGGYVEKMGILDAIVENGIVLSHVADGNETFFDVQDYSGDSVRIVTTDVMPDNTPDEYGYPTRRRLFTHIDADESDKYRFGNMSINVYENGGIGLYNYGYYPLPNESGVLHIGDGTYYVSKNVYGNFNIVPDVDYQIVQVMRHDVENEECYVKFIPNYDYENLYDKSCFAAIHHDGLNYPLDAGNDGGLFVFYEYDLLKYRVDNNQNLIQQDDVPGMYSYPGATPPYDNGVRLFNDTSAVADLQINGDDKFYCYGIIGYDDRDFACVYTPVYNLGSVKDIVLGSGSGDEFDGHVYVNSPSDSYLRSHNCSLKIFDTSTDTELYSISDIMFEQVIGSPNFMEYYIGLETIPFGTQEVLISITDVTGMEHYKNITLSW